MCMLEKLVLISTKELAVRLGLSRRQIARLNRCGKLPTALKVGSSVRWISSEIDRWLLAGCPDRMEWQEMKGGEV